MSIKNWHPNVKTAVNLSIRGRPLFKGRDQWLYNYGNQRSRSSTRKIFCFNRLSLKFEHEMSTYSQFCKVIILFPVPTTLKAIQKWRHTNLDNFLEETKLSPLSVHDWRLVCTLQELILLFDEGILEAGKSLGFGFSCALWQVQLVPGLQGQGSLVGQAKPQLDQSLP